jgi:hypothetical protein
MNPYPATHEFNNQSFNISITLINTYNQQVLATTGSWRNLFITDDFLTGFLTGYIEILNTDDAFLKPNTKIGYPGFKFEGNGQDIIHIRIIPTYHNDAAVSVVEIFEKQIFDATQTWGIEMMAVVTQSDRIHDDKLHQSYLKLSFRETPLYILQSTPTRLGSSDFLNETENISYLDQLTMTPDALSVPANKFLFWALQQYEPLKDHLSDDESLWDQCEKYKAVFPSFFQSLHELSINTTKYHRSENGEICYLRLNRAPFGDAPKLSFLSFKQYLENLQNGDDEKNTYKELFLLQASGSEESVIIQNKNKLEGNNLITPISEFSVLEPDAFHASQLVYNILAFYFDGKQWVNTYHPVKKSKAYFTEIMKDSQLDTRNNSQLTFSEKPYDIPDDLGTLKFYPHTSLLVPSLPSDDTDAIVPDILKHIIFEGFGMAIIVDGFPNRKAGTFFGVQETRDNETEWHDKLEGQYFCTSVMHHFNNMSKTYKNSVIGTKFYQY